MSLRRGSVAFWTRRCVGSKNTVVLREEFSRVLKSHHLQAQPEAKAKNAGNVGWGLAKSCRQVNGRALPCAHTHSLPASPPGPPANENSLMRLLLGDSYSDVNQASPQVLNGAFSFQGHKAAFDSFNVQEFPGHKEGQVQALRSSQLVGIQTCS